MGDPTGAESVPGQRMKHELFPSPVGYVLPAIRPAPSRCDSVIILQLVRGLNEWLGLLSHMQTIMGRDNSAIELTLCHNLPFVD